MKEARLQPINHGGKSWPELSLWGLGLLSKVKCEIVDRVGKHNTQKVMDRNECMKTSNFISAYRKK